MGGGSGKSIQRTLCVKKLIRKPSLIVESDCSVSEKLVEVVAQLINP